MNTVFLACAAAASFLVQPPVSPPASTKPPAVTPEAQAIHEVIVEGRAPLGAEGRDSARKAAIAQALRSAVEQTTEVLVYSATLTRNYQLVQDRVITRAEGFATPEAVLHEVDDAREVRVTVRVLVSLHPLTQTLQALHLTHIWRVHLNVAPFKMPWLSKILSVSPQAALEKAFTDVGLVVVPADQPADIAVEVTNRFGAYSVREPANPKRMDIKSEMTARATMIRTGDVIAVQFADYPPEQLRPEAHEAQLQNVCDRMTAEITPGLTESLLLGPARTEQSVALEVDGIGSLSHAAAFEKAISTLPQVTSVVRKRYEKGNAQWIVQVLADTETETAHDLATNPVLQPYHLTVLSDEPTRIVAGTDSLGPHFPVKGIDAGPHSPYLVQTSIESVSGLVRLKPAKSPESPTLGSLLAYDAFDYPSEQKVDGRGVSSQGWSGPWAVLYNTRFGPEVVAGSLYYPHLKIAGNAFKAPVAGVVRHLDPPLGAPGQILYVSTLIRPVTPTLPDYVDAYACLNLNGIRIGKSRGTANVSIMTQAMLYTPHKFLASDVPMNPDTTYFLVGRLTIGASSSTFDLFVDPDPEKPLPPKADATLSVNVTRVTEIRYEAETPCLFDELRVGNTYEAVAPKW